MTEDARTAHEKLRRDHIDLVKEAETGKRSQRMLKRISWMFNPQQMIAWVLTKCAKTKKLTMEV